MSALPEGSIITREVTFSILTDKEKDNLAEGFSKHMEELVGMPCNPKDTYNLLTVLNPWIKFYRLDGEEKFRVSVSKRVLASKLGLQ